MPDDGLDRLVARMRAARRRRSLAWLAAIGAMAAVTLLSLPAMVALVLGVWEMSEFPVTGVLLAPWMGLALAILPGAWVGAQALGVLLPKRDEDDIAQDG